MNFSMDTTDLSILANLSEADIITRLIVAAFLGAVVGIEREFHRQPAGLRTHIILCIGSALAMCVSIRLAMDYRTLAPNGDPARLAAQVISGIGFLGAGAIMRYGTSIKGLTTATSLWTIAIVGIAVGAGHFLAAVAATGLQLTTLVVLDYVEKKFIHGRATRTIHLDALDRPHIVQEFEDILTMKKIDIKSMNVNKNLEENQIEIEALVKLPEAADIDDIVDTLSMIPGAKKFEVE
ncbi:MAG: MgtC/SapB family protein [Candidatus Hydrogenedentota bacterium]